MHTHKFLPPLLWTAALLSCTQAQDPSLALALAPAATGFEADNTAFYYTAADAAAAPLLLANDGSAANGGFRTFQSANSTPFAQKAHRKTGRSKVVVPVYDVGGRDYFVAIAAPDSIMRVFDAEGGEEVEGARKKQLGDWSVGCVWRSGTSGESYLFLFGKRVVVQFLVGGRGGEVRVVEVQSFAVPIEGETCAVFGGGRVFFSAEDSPLYSFQAAESTLGPEVRTVSEDVEVVGLGAYRGTSGDYLFVAHDESVDVYDEGFVRKGSVSLSGIVDLSIGGGLAVLQSSMPGYPLGALAFAFEGEDDTGVAIGSLEVILTSLNITANTKFNPKSAPCNDCLSPISRCSNSGFAQAQGCQCFAGFSGKTCSQTTCKNNCSGNGKCAGANTCQCNDGWEGPDCSFVAVEAKYETDANGGDGDDPAIWIHPTEPGSSRIITTTKSEAGAGFAVFDLAGKLLQHTPGAEPNNVDIIYNFTVGPKSVDLTFAACRRDNTLCLLEVNSTGLLHLIAGGVQPTPDDYEVYGSCTYRSPKSGKQFLFVNNKDALYLQYELLSSANGTLSTNLVRNFTGGSGGQVEGCVADEAAGFLFLGEEPSGLWRYDAEPEGSPTGIQIAAVGDGWLSADVEGLTLVPAKNGTGGYLFVSSQGISSYLVYERAPPHDYVLTFTIVDNEKAGIDHVSNTDGIAAVGDRLNGDFPGGLFVTHDDANELYGGGTAEEASFKLVSLVDILGEERVKSLGH